MNLKDMYINFFVSKGHVQIPSSPVVPENDPSVLFNTAGMQPLIPYLMEKCILVEQDFVIIKSVLELMI